MTKKTILITGATGAIGKALATYYAKPGVHVLLHGRNTTKLEPVAHECRAQGAAVSLIIQDLQDTEGWLACIDQQILPVLPDLVIANAGININLKPDGSRENWQELQALLDINIKSTFALANALLPAMKQRGSGQIALVSSLAGFYGLAIVPSYSASKAAIKAYGEALRGLLAKDGVKVNVVMPGYVQSDMCDAMPGPKPFLWPTDKAARFIARGLDANKARITFPFPLNFGCWWLAVLPPSISQFFVKLIYL